MGDGRRIWLYCPVVALLITDVALTLSGQPAAYWAGDYAVAIESNPVVRPLLAHAPDAFLAATMIWLIALSAIILCWPSRAWGWRVAAGTAGIGALVHAVASASWLVRSGGWYWLMAVAYLAGMAELSWWCWRRAVAFAEPGAAADRPRE